MNLDPQEIEEELPEHERQFRQVEEAFENVMTDPNVSDEEKKTTSGDMDDLKENWDNFTISLKEKENRCGPAVLR